MKIHNSYSGIDFAKVSKVNSITHEHIYDASTWKSAYDRGIRHFPALHYQPACPRFPASNYAYLLKDGVPQPNSYKDFADIVNGDFSLVDKVLKGKIESFIDANGNTIYTDTLPQVPNNEHPTFTEELGKTTNFLNHFNVLGNLWAEAGWGIGVTPAQRQGYPICDLSDFEKFFDSENQYFNGKVMVTINHATSISSAKKIINAINGRCPIAIEVYNDDYTSAFRQKFMSLYDSLLSEGLRLYCVSAIDWQSYIEEDLTPEEQVHWQSMYNSLEVDEKAQYATWQEFYKSQGREISYDRGCNVLLVGNEYNQLPANDFIQIEGKSYPNLHSATYTQAEYGLDMYLQGKFYASGFGNHSITNLSVDGNKVTFSVDGNATEIAAITNKGRIVGNGNTMQVTIPPGVNFIRFEALYNADEKKDFIYTQPLFIEDNEESVSFNTAKRMLIL